MSMKLTRIFLGMFLSVQRLDTDVRHKSPDVLLYL